MALETQASPADRCLVPARAAEEKGFGLIELLIAMVVLNVGILAVVGAFQSGALALGRSSLVSNGTAVADRVMEVYRNLRNCGIYLTSSTIPVSGSPNYTQYVADPTNFGNVGPYSGSNPLWVTETTGTGYSPILPSSAACIPSGLALTPTNAVQTLTGPDGRSYTAFVYIVILQPAIGGAAGLYTKQVTVVVLDPQDSARVLARESSVFDPNVDP
jgi:type II secretory pathway pseudopilin PulG